MSNRYRLSALSAAVAGLFFAGRIIAIWPAQTNWEPVVNEISASVPVESLWTTPQFIPEGDLVRIQRGAAEQKIDMHATTTELPEILHQLSTRGDLHSMVLRQEGTQWHINTSLLPPGTKIRGSAPTDIPDLRAITKVLPPDPASSEEEPAVQLASAETASPTNDSPAGFVQFVGGQRLDWQWNEHQLHLGSPE